MADTQTPQVQNLVLQGNAAFTNRLYQILAKEPGNLFFSPLSIHAVVSMAHQGAREETAKAIEEVLQIPDAEATAEGYRAITEQLKSLMAVLVYLAFKIYVKKGLELEDTFVENIQKHFSSEVECVDFRDKYQVVKDINQWVEKQTNEKIKNILTPDFITGGTMMLLINSIYFKGRWFFPFSEKLTKTEKFFVDETNSVDVQMMHKIDDRLYKYDEELEAQIALFLFQGVNVRMVIVLPKDRNGIKSLERKLSDVGFTGLVENLASQQLIISMPKFKMESTVDLSETLKQMGLENIFSQEANFSGMLKTGSTELYVTQVFQKAFIDLNEWGAEAAAVSVGKMSKKAGWHQEGPVDFVVDHPALFLLVADVKGIMNILFCGRLSHPCY
ncbi:hypothetical protein Zmor_012548 [Zophobas morio]|uniref:Serpin domain-containing protein n=1 Tax=Zophobas morio TaxID=2755281 RepID=A0AA38MEI1_9CUCU|nr:hypothetical protein Zmor_012548 [Zophobas morio]